MPTLLREGPYRFFFYAFEGSPLEPAHVHVESGDETAKYWLRPEVTMARNNGYSARELRRIQRIVEAHAPQFEEAWNEFFG